MIFIWSQANAESGIIEAKTKQWAEAKLLQKNITKVSIRKIAEPAFSLQSNISNLEIANFFFNLGNLLESKFSLIKALTLLSKSKLHYILQDFITVSIWQLEKGVRFSDSFKFFEKYFDSLQINCIQIAEETANLPQQLKHLSNYYKLQDQYSASIAKAIRYPLFLLIFALLISLVLLMAVVPEFANTFASLDADIPKASQFILSLSSTLKANSSLILSMLLIIVLLPMVIIYKFPIVKAHIKKFLIKIKVFSGFWQLDTMLFFSQSLLTLSNARINFDKGLKYLLDNSNDYYIKNIITQLLYEINQGSSLYNAIAKQKIFDSYFVEVFNIADSNQQINNHLQKLVVFYQQQLEKNIETKSRLIEPTIILLVGAFIGLLLILIYLPLFQIGQAF